MVLKQVSLPSTLVDPSHTNAALDSSSLDSPRLCAKMMDIGQENLSVQLAVSQKHVSLWFKFELGMSSTTNNFCIVHIVNLQK